MALVPNVRAVTFHRLMDHGATQPGLVACRDESGATADYVVKWHSELGLGSVFELVAALLAHSLELPTPQVALVEVPFTLLSYLPDENTRKTVRPGLHFGSLYMPGWQLLRSDFPIKPAQIPAALDVFAFDMLIQNADRFGTDVSQMGKTNLLHKGDAFLMIDHEKAFSFVRAIGDVPEPWDLRAFPCARTHLFTRFLRSCNDKVCFDPFVDHLKRLGEDWLLQLVAEVPDVWDSGAATSRIVTHVTQVLRNVDRFERGLREVLA